MTKKILKQVLEEIKPEKENVREVEGFLKKLNSEIKKHKIKAKATAGGSYAKDTWLKGDYDVDIFVKFDPPNDIYMLFPDYNSDENQDGDEPTLKQGNMPGGVSITGTNFNGNSFKFDSRGLASVTGGTISLKNNLNTLTRIRINRTGNSRILADDE